MEGKPVGFIPRTSCGLVVVVPDRGHVEQLFRLGYYGSSSTEQKITPVFLMNKTVAAQGQETDWAEPLHLTACEAFYLLENENLELSWLEEQAYNRIRLSKEVCWNVFFQWYRNKSIRFPVLYAAYSYLKKQGWVVKQSVALGSHFSLYKEDPNICHSSFSVLVTSTHSEVRWLTVSRLNRVANQVAKDLVVVRVDLLDEETKVSCPANITAIIIRRFSLN